MNHWGIRGLAFLLAAALFCLLPGCRAEEEAQIGEYALTEAGYLVAREDVSATLLVGMEGDWPSAGGVLSLALAVLDGADGAIQVVQIPLETRAEATLYDEEGKAQGKQYMALSEAYAQGAAGVDGGLTNLADAVSGLLGGVPVEKWIAYSKSGLMRMVNAAGGVEMELDAQLEGSTLAASGEKKLNGAEAWEFFSYLKDSAAGGQQRRQRQLRLLIGWLEKARQTGIYDVVSAAFSRAGKQARYNVDGDWYAMLSRAQLSGAAAGTETSGFVLFGEERVVEEEAFWMPGKAAIKEWVLQTFYRAGEEQSADAADAAGQTQTGEENVL